MLKETFLVSHLLTMLFIEYKSRYCMMHSSCMVSHWGQNCIFDASADASKITFMTTRQKCNYDPNGLPYSWCTLVKCQSTPTFYWEAGHDVIYRACCTCVKSLLLRNGILVNMKLHEASVLKWTSVTSTQFKGQDAIW